MLLYIYSSNVLVILYSLNYEKCFSDSTCNSIINDQSLHSAGPMWKLSTQMTNLMCMCRIRRENGNCYIYLYLFNQNKDNFLNYLLKTKED